MPKPLSHNGLVFLRLKDSPPRETYAGLLYVQQEKPYGRGWLAHKFKAIYGKWPNPQTPVDPQPPSNDLREWLGLERRRYRAKMKRLEAKGVVPPRRTGKALTGNLNGVTFGEKPESVAVDQPASELMSEQDWGVKL